MIEEPDDELAADRERERLAAAIEVREQLSAPGKAFASPSGWLFLINDSNDFLRYQLGVKRWSEDERGRAAEIIRERHALLAHRGARYFKFILPEKSAIYAEHLPPGLDAATFAGRPASLLSADAPGVFHAAEALRRHKPFGQLYFRGDTHPTWYGAWQIYRYVHHIVSREWGPIGAPVPLFALKRSLATFDGDLYAQLSEGQKRWFDALIEDSAVGGSIEALVKYELTAENRLFRFVEPDEEYRGWFKRPLFVTHSSDRSLPKAVIIRDSTSEYVVDLLAQHFSRALFYWREGQLFDEVIEREKPDLVIHIMAERFVTAYPTSQAIVPLHGRPVETFV